MDVEPNPTKPATTPTPDAPSPIKLGAMALGSLLVFGAIGWGLRGLRQGGAAEPVETAVESSHAHESPSPAPTLSRGRLIFQVHCARCHGPEGRGDGPDSATLRPPPRDLQGVAWRIPPSRASIRNTVAEGLPNSMMPALAASLSKAEIESVVDHVLTLAPKASTPAPAGPAVDLTPWLSKAGFVPSPTGRAAPAFSVQGADAGDTVALERLRGRFVVLAFWGTRCAPCLEELPQLQTLATRRWDQGLSVVAVCADEDDPAVVKEVAGKVAPGLPVYTDPTGLAKLNYDVQSLPSCILIDASGNQLGQSTGALHWSSPEVEALLHAGLDASGQGKTDQDAAKAAK
ncbi:redoxin family protein [Singulisphaera sp. PoT]|uniref:redoxin family protein n=1 Tax=Singulisphaera sp. PoT TaxID=3411797 RepID=UPI003BF61BBE